MKLLSTIMLLTLPFLFSCYKPPAKEISEARSALRDALVVQANIYAPSEYRSAEDLLNMAHDEISEEEYECARIHAVNARDVAFLAKTAALNNKTKQESLAKSEPPESSKTPQDEIGPSGGGVDIKELNGPQDGEGGISETANNDGESQADSLVGAEESGLSEGIADSKLKESVPEESAVGGVSVNAEEQKAETNAEWFKLLSVYFDFDAYDVKDIEKEKLVENAKWLIANAKGKKIIVEGNCDERGSSEYNLALGAKRAANLKQFLIENGLDKESVETVSFGEEKPAYLGHNENSWQKNRRGEFKIKE